MGLLKSLLKSTPAVNDELSAVDGFLLKAHRGTLTSEDRVCLGDLTRKLLLSDEQLEARQKAVVARKEKEREEHEARTNPPFGKSGVRLREPVVVKRFVRYAGERGPNDVFVADLLRDNPAPTPPADLTEWHRHPADAAGDFEALVDVLRRLDAGELVPGRVAYLKLGAERFGYGGALPVIVADEIVSGSRVRNLSFIRLPGQSQKQLDAALAVLREKEGDGLLPPERRKW